MNTSPRSGEANPRLSARQRLLDAADELFYEGGIHSVGIDRIIERAGVAKASLYDVFGSKDALIGAYLAARQDSRRERIERELARHHEPRARLLAVFEALTEPLKDANYRGCAFARASAESRPSEAVRKVSDDARSWTRELLASLARDAGAAKPERLAQQLGLLYDGAAASALIDANTAAGKVARSTAELLIDLAIEERGRRVKS